eukprot:scaffold24568_cov70-Phaeocystis_antarctica.AAC.5
MMCSPAAAQGCPLSDCPTRRGRAEPGSLRVPRDHLLTGCPRCRVPLSLCSPCPSKGKARTREW